MPLDDDAASLLALIKASGQAPYHTLSPVDARLAMQRARAATAPDTIPISDVRDFNITHADEALAIRMYRPAITAETLPLLLFFHGGGWVIGDLQTHDGVCRHLAAASGCAVMAVDYRLAPEHKYPAAIQDAIAALEWVVRNAQDLCIDPARIAVGGDSAGANLAAVLAIMSRNGEVPALRFQMLLYPALDLSMVQDSYVRMGDGYLLTTATMRWFRGHYLSEDNDVAHWHISPLKVPRLDGVASTIILTAGFDPLVDEGLAFAARLKDSDIEVEHQHFPGQMHGFLTQGKVLPTARKALDLLSQSLKRTLTA